MHVLFVHRNFPAQFGHIAARLVRERGWKATFVSEQPPGEVDGIRKIQYRTEGGATDRAHYFSRGFENAVWHAAAVYDALKRERTMTPPDLIVGHSGFGSTLYLRELFPAARVINYFEWFYRPAGGDLDFRPDDPVTDYDRLRSVTKNAMILLDLDNCDAGYSPTRWQQSRLPAEFRPKVQVLHDGIDTSFWCRRAVPGRAIGTFKPPRDLRIVTYVSRGLEQMRGFDVFMKVAKRVCKARSDVVFLVVGADRVAYGGDLRHTYRKTFKQHVLEQDDYDLSRIKFVGNVPPDVLAQVLSISDLHIYLTAPFVLSWSLLNAMACECTLLTSATPPVEEFVEDGRNGLLRDFFDVDGLTEAALEVLADPAAHRGLGQVARADIERAYSVDEIIPQMESFYRKVVAQTP